MIYQVFQLQDASRPGPPGLVDYTENLSKTIRQQGSEIWGVFGNLLGLASNQVYLVIRGEQQLELTPPTPISLVDSWQFSPTIRPVDHKPMSAPGVYVFRWFSITAGTQDEIVQLSGAAWPTFERNFDTQIQGLFVEDVDQPTTMLLVTRYRDLSVWEASRHPPEEARENFLARHRLTLSALPVATTLLSPGSRLISHR